MTFSDAWLLLLTQSFFITLSVSKHSPWLTCGESSHTGHTEVAFCLGLIMTATVTKADKSTELSVLWQACDCFFNWPFSLPLNCWCFLEFNSWLSHLFTLYMLPNLIHSCNFRFLLDAYDSQGCLDNVHNCSLCIWPWNP